MLIHHSDDLRQIFDTSNDTTKLNISDDYYNGYNKLIDEDIRPYEDCFEAYIGQMYMESKTINEISEVIAEIIHAF